MGWMSGVLRCKSENMRGADDGSANPLWYLVIVTLNGMLEEYQMFITGLAAREKAPTFDELEGILLQEEERRKNLNCKSSSSDLALLASRQSMGKKQGW
jgi:hypothetical protein